MTTRITIDQAGRVIIPKVMREELHLRPGDELELTASNDQIILNPVRPKALVKKERGVWVYQGEPTDASIPDLIEREREKRFRETIR